MTIAPNAWGTMLHMVELYRDRGETLKAEVLIRSLRAQRDRLDEDLREALDELSVGSGRGDE
ncbi:MAG: hypothetical protein O3C57_02310 [Verrucomicrobia bacterium]|nr:hypothetical protein [Verrucomicrobiota bacterium]